MAAEGRERSQVAVGALLRRFRSAAGLSQEELAERAELSVQAIRAIERGRRRRPYPQTLRSLGSALGLTAEQRVLLFEAAARSADRARGQSDPAPVHSNPTRDAAARLAEARALLATMPSGTPSERGALPAGSRMPLAPNPLFVGRADELLQIAATLRGGDTTVPPGQVVAATGLGGLGKTQLAVEFVHRYGRFFTGGVFWLGFASADEIPLQVAACAGSVAVGLEADLSSWPLEERVKLVMGAWQSPVPRLLVFDDCEEESLLEAWRPSSGGCRVLVTSRRSQWSPTLGVTALPLEVLPRLHSIDLLRRYRPDLVADPRLDAIAVELGDLPLALDLAGRYLLAYRADVGLDDYLVELDHPELIRHASLLGEGLDDWPSPTHHVRSVAQTFALCLARLDREREVDRVALALLARMACLAPGKAVPRELLGRTLEEVGPRRRADGLRRLGAVGLVEEQEGSLRLHRLLVHFVRQAVVDPDAQAAVDRTLVCCGEAAEQGRLTGSALAAVIPHLSDAARAAVGALRDECRAAELCAAAGLALYHAGDLTAARPWCEGALTIRERVLGPDHHDTATSLNDLGVLLYDRHELAAARPLYERALAIRERVLGPDHPDSAETLNNLSVLFRARGELAAARPLAERALAIWERVLGSDHALTAHGLYCLGVLLWEQCDLDAAGPLLGRALDIYERVLGPDHPDTAFGLSGLARVLHAQGDLDAARARCSRALAIRERMLGREHPHTAISLHDLGVLLADRGEREVARAHLERALGIRELVLGPDHPDTVATRLALTQVAGEEGPTITLPSSSR